MKQFDDQELLAWVEQLAGNDSYELEVLRERLAFIGSMEDRIADLEEKNASLIENIMTVFIDAFCDEHAEEVKHESFDVFVRKSDVCLRCVQRDAARATALEEELLSLRERTPVERYELIELVSGLGSSVWAIYDAHEQKCIDFSPGSAKNYGQLLLHRYRNPDHPAWISSSDNNKEYTPKDP